MRERDLAGRDGMFLAEGRVVLEKLLATDPLRIQSVLVSEAKLPGIAGLLTGLPADTPVYVASQAVMDAIAGFPIHRGVLALGRRPERDPADLLAGLSQDALVVGLCGLANHDNVGGVFRNAGAFGVDAVLLDAPCCDPLYRKAIRVSVGATLTVPYARLGPGEDVVARLEGAGFEVLALSPRGEARLEDVRPSGRCAVLFGAEGPGLAPEILARTRTVRLQMAGGFDSLNVATTSGIVLHHLANHRS